MASRKRIYTSFSRALRETGFTFDGEVATSEDKSVRVEFLGLEWNLYIDNKFILSWETKTGSMEKLRRVLSTHNKKLTTHKISKKKKKDPSLIESIIEDITNG